MSRLVGLNAIQDLARIAPQAITRLYLSDGAGPDEVRFADRLAAEGCPISRVSGGALQERAGGRGGATIAAELVIARPRGLEAYVAAPLEARTLLVLDQVTDPHNLGAILRSAAVFGVEAVVVPRNGSAALTDAAIRSSAGAAALIPIERVTNLARALRDLEQQGFWTCAVTGEAQQSLWNLDFRGASYALALGAEGHGMRPGVARACQLRCRIDGGGTLATLNVGVAAAVALAEVSRQRLLPSDQS
jgi:23S rRNA (guanosine2251-2'-O)-methyltransferase